MKLQPLKQWICDSCGRVIAEPEHGCLEWLSWLSEQSKVHNNGFKIVHHHEHSPRKPSGSCYCYDTPPQGKLKMDFPLSEFIGTPGIIHLLTFIDRGPFLEEPFQGPHVEDLREWTELFRRITLPFYEEARLYMKRANTDGFFGESNEELIYFPSTLKEVIKRYGG
jgi:hypothetical protein